MIHILLLLFLMFVTSPPVDYTNEEFLGIYQRVYTDQLAVFVVVSMLGFEGKRVC